MEVFRVIILLVCVCWSLGRDYNRSVQMIITPSQVDIRTSSASQSVTLECCFTKDAHVESVQWIQIAKMDSDHFYTKVAYIDFHKGQPKTSGNFKHWIANASINIDEPSLSYLRLSKQLSTELLPFYTGEYRCAIKYPKWGDHLEKTYNCLEVTGTYDATTITTPAITTSTVDKNFSEQTTTHQKFITHTDTNPDTTTGVTAKTTDCSNCKDETTTQGGLDKDILTVLLSSVSAVLIIVIVLVVYRCWNRGNAVTSNPQQNISQAIDNDEVQPVDNNSYEIATSSTRRELGTSNTMSWLAILTNNLPDGNPTSNGAKSNQHPKQSISIKTKPKSGEVTQNVPDYVNTRYKMHRPLHRVKRTPIMSVNEVVNTGSSETNIDAKPIEVDPLLAYTDSRGYVKQNVFNPGLPEMLKTSSRLVHHDGDDSVQQPGVEMKRLGSNDNNGLIGHIDKFGYLDLNISQPTQKAPVKYSISSFDDLRDANNKPDSADEDLECETVDGQGYVNITCPVSTKKCVCTRYTNDTGRLRRPLSQSMQWPTSNDIDVNGLTVDVSNSLRQRVDSQYVNTSLTLPTIDDHGYDYVGIYLCRRKVVVEHQQPSPCGAVVGNGYLTPI